jgi:hypothetical protein
LKVIADKMLSPPKCSASQYLYTLVQAEMSQHEFDGFESAEDEFSTTEKTYYSNAGCSKFVPSKSIEAD